MFTDQMTMFSDHPAFDGHKLVTARTDLQSGLHAIIAVHDDTRGPAIGGCRIYPYPTTDTAVADCLRLSRGMTYKTAIADIPYGGGKAVIIADPRRDKSSAMLHAFGDFVESLGGLYITSFDSGTNLDDVRTIARRTSFAAGAMDTAIDASESTADGVFVCLKAAVEARLRTSNLSGIRIAVQGVGNVGSRLVSRLRAEGAMVSLADRDKALAERVAADFGCSVVDVDEIHRVEAEVFSPNALGGILNHVSIAELGAPIVVGGANNQLAEIEDDRRLAARGITYCPDYLANAGGIINLHYQRSQWSLQNLDRHVESLADTFREVLNQSRFSGRPTGEIADAIAQTRISAARIDGSWRAK